MRFPIQATRDRLRPFPTSYHTHHGYAWMSIAALMLGGLSTGCNSRPPAMIAPEIDLAAATDAAFEAYDANGDGILTDGELANCPGVRSAKHVYDADGDQQISKEEMTARMGHWKSGPAFMTLDCQVTLDGRPLPEAVVRYVPESYLDEWILPASGTADGSGMAAIGISPDDLPPSHQRLRALNAGVYKVEITHPSISIPEKYNAKTTLGREVSKETRAVPMEVFKLRRS